MTNDGNKDEFVNEDLTLDGIGLFIPLLKLVERHGDMEEKVNQDQLMKPVHPLLSWTETEC